MSEQPPATKRATPRRRNVGRVLGNIAVAIVILAVMAGAFALSYTPVRDIAREAGVASPVVRIYSGILDAVFLVCCVCALMLRNARWWTRLFAWLSVLVTGALIGAADVYHATGLRLPRRTLDGTVWALPWALVLLAFSLWISTLQHTKSDRDIQTPQPDDRPAPDAPVLALEATPAARAALPAPEAQAAEASAAQPVAAGNQAARNGGLADVGLGRPAATPGVAQTEPAMAEEAPEPAEPAEPAKAEAAAGAEQAVTTEAAEEAERPAVTEDAPMAEEAPVTGEPVAEEAPVAMEPPAAGESVAEEAPVVAEPPAAVVVWPPTAGEPMTGEAPVVAEPPVAAEAPVAGEFAEGGQAEAAGETETARETEEAGGTAVGHETTEAGETVETANVEAVSPPPAAPAAPAPPTAAAAAPPTAASTADDDTPAYGFPVVTEQDVDRELPRMPTLLGAPVPADMTEPVAVDPATKGKPPAASAELPVTEAELAHEDQPAQEPTRPAQSTAPETPTPAPFERVRSTPRRPAE